jgi:hypothetical protein
MKEYFGLVEPVTLMTGFVEVPVMVTPPVPAVTKLTTGAEEKPPSLSYTKAFPEL